MVAKCVLIANWLGFGSERRAVSRFLSGSVVIIFYFFSFFRCKSQGHSFILIQHSGKYLMFYGSIFKKKLSRISSFFTTTLHRYHSRGWRLVWCAFRVLGLSPAKQIKTNLNQFLIKKKPSKMIVPLGPSSKAVAPGTETLRVAGNFLPFFSNPVCVGFISFKNNFRFFTTIICIILLLYAIRRVFLHIWTKTFTGTLAIRQINFFREWFRLWKSARCKNIFKRQREGMAGLGGGDYPFFSIHVNLTVLHSVRKNELCVGLNLRP